ncbi:TPA: helix-turn-helix transcriptional regulator [Streptococcus suis]|nr:helix-turn-helix transcriptional regulator [Streptococcus suis]HEL1701614.1 helix-turn-helix transcriptional regulator [Streptococcus suis]HEL1824935.1 helix-turn-helix transcriptional regulator [Streptococcus suis]HEM4990858.1 helix-turn-helix transcriptional regulator [Streptococcus suis]HEM5247180.1 helix-turn-helix transcriptional regulator [Streptococcus suis]
MNSISGSRFKQRRKELGLTQSALAKDICEQSLISRIENTNLSPSSEILFLLSNRLGVTMNYFFEEFVQESRHSIGKIRTIFSQQLLLRNYEIVEQLYVKEVESRHLLNEEDKAYLDYIFILVRFYLYNERDFAIKEFDRLNAIIAPHYYFYLDFLNSYTIFLGEVGEDDKYMELVSNVKSEVSKLDLSINADFQAYIKIGYNYARFLLKRKQTNLALDEVTELINQLNAYNSSFLLPDLLCLLGNISKGLLREDEVLDLYEQALVLYKLQGNTKLYLSLKNFLVTMGKEIY